MNKLYTNSIIVGISGVISLILFLLLEYKSHLLSDRQLIGVFYIYIISCVIFVVKGFNMMKNSVKGE